MYQCTKFTKNPMKIGMDSALADVNYIAYRSYVGNYVSQTVILVNDILIVVHTLCTNLFLIDFKEGEREV